MLYVDPRNSRMEESVKRIVVGVLLGVAAVIPTTAQAKAPTAAQVTKVTAQFKHDFGPRMVVAAQEPATHLRYSCWRPVQGLWKCDVLIFDDYMLVAAVVHFRGTSMVGRPHYMFPHGIRWHGATPGLVPDHFLNWFITGFNVGKPMREGRALSGVLPPWRNCC